MPVQFILPPDNRAIGAGNPAGDTNGLTDAVIALGGDLSVLNAAWGGGADPTGAADSTAAIQAALNAAVGGQAVLLPAGIYQVTAPLIVPAGVTLQGEKGPTPSIYDINPPANAAIIKPAATWSAGAVSPAGVLVLGGDSIRLRDFVIDCRLLWTNLSAGQLTSSSLPNVTTDGVNDGSGGARAISMRNVGVYAATSHGFLQNGTAWHAAECVSDVAYADCFWGGWVDSILVNCHGQSGGINGTGSGIFMNGPTQTILVAFRGELSQHGITCNMTSTTSKGTTMLIGAGTQRNNQYGIRVTSSSAAAGRSPLVIAGWRSTGDGVNGTVSPTGGSPGGTITGGAGGSPFAALKVEGDNEVVITGMECVVNTADAAAGCPAYAVTTALVGTLAPHVVSIDNAFLNTQTGVINDAAPAQLLTTGPSVTSYTGGIFPGGATTVTPVPVTPFSSQGLKVTEGSNAKQGTATLAAGSAVVSNTSVTSTSRIFLTSNADGGTPGWLRVSARTAGTSFTITSSSGTDTSTVAWEIFEVG